MARSLARLLAVLGAAAASLPPVSSEAERHDYCVVGGGLAGLQLGYFFEQAGRDYVILERGPGAGTFFRKFPRHRSLISINKRHTGRGGSGLALEHNLRHDWHSLLSGLHSGDVEEDMLFHKLTDEFYPHADKLADYAEKWAERYALNIRTNADVTRVRKAEGGGFELDVAGSSGSEAPLLSCRWVIVASGLSTPNVPDIPGLEENSVSYNDMPTERAFYANKTVAILGAGNAGFETFKAVMADAAYVHIHGPSHIRMAWETHYVGDLRSVNVVPVDNYQLKSQDILHLPSPVGLTKDTTVVGIETMPDGKEAICMKDINHDKMVDWLEKDRLPSHLKGVQTGHSLTFEERFTNVDRYCYDVIIRCTGFRVDTSIFDFPLATEGGRTGKKYAAVTAEYESTSAEGLYVAGTLAHIRDFRRSSGGFVHGFRYTARALFKLLEQKNHDVPWPRDEVLLDERETANENEEEAGGGWFGGGEESNDEQTQTLTEKLTDRMDSSSGLYQMFNELCDLVILPRAGARYAATLQAGEGDDDGEGNDASQLKAEYLEEVPIDLVPMFVDADREYVLLTMEYGPDFHGHERVLRQERVFHNFDPIKAHKSQFLHPILRYYAPDVQSSAEGGETAAHHVLEDTYTNFSNPTLHVAPMAKFLERFRTKPLLTADAPLGTRWVDVAPRQQMAADFQPATTKTRKSHRGMEWRKSSKGGSGSSSGGMSVAAPGEANESSKVDEARPAPGTLKARELKDLLRERNLDTRGTKAQLVSRLEEAYKVEL